MKPLLRDLEVNVVRHCNLACVACNHGSPVAEREWMRLETLEQDLYGLAEFAHWELCMIQGGEPTLRKDLADFMLVIQQTGISDRIGILTNGTLLRTMPPAFWKIAEKVGLELRISVYPVLKKEDLKWAEDVCRFHGIKFFANPPYTHFMKMFARHADGGRSVWEQCPWKSCYTVHEGWLYRCPPSAFFPKQFPEMFDEKPDEHVDGWKLSEFNESTMQEIMGREEPLRACSICVGHGTERVEWGQTRNREEWIKASTV